MQNKVKDLLSELGVLAESYNHGDILVSSPISGTEIGRVQTESPNGIEAKIQESVKAFNTWRTVPAPRRGELVRIFGQVLREHKDTLAALVTAECGKIFEEGKGEVQEMIDICEFALGLSRQLHGLTIQSERPGHHMRETWQPLGPVGIISAFNFPVAVWAWNAALALICGNTLLWKPSEKTPLTALACQALLDQAIERFGSEAPRGLSTVIVGARETGMVLVDDRRIPLISATGSCRMGREVAPRVAERFGKTILELGGNNAVIVTPSADLKLAVPGIVFGAIGTAGQRCTSTRRLIVHRSRLDEVTAALKAAYASVSIGDPLDTEHLVGPLIDKAAYDGMQAALSRVSEAGGIITGGERILTSDYADAYYVKPALVELTHHHDCIREETFAPILYIMPYDTFEEAVALQNSVDQGLSSAVFTTDIREAEAFLSASGSDCGLANVNIGTSGAEIGGAFGGEKDTGGGRESGSDAWKGYMRRQTSTVNYSHELPLAQGITFNLT